jgi:two-component system sensor histidine kinase KdpD
VARKESVKGGDRSGLNPPELGRLRYPVAAGFVLAATGVGLVLDTNTTAASLLLLLAVVLAALLGRATGAMAAVFGFLTLNWFFTAPRHTFAVSKRDDLLALATFVVVAIVVGTLMSRADVLRRRAADLEREARVRLELLRRLGAGDEPHGVVEQAATALVDLYGLAGCVLTVSGIEAQAWSSRDRGEETRVTAGGNQAIVIESPGRSLTGDDHALVEAMVAGLGTALERLHLEAEAREARIAAVVGRTRSGFLSAVSHNLRTPLSAIKASVSTLLAPDVELERDARRELLDTIYEESDRLERLVAKVLDLSRIRAGGLEPEREPVDVADLARIAIRRLRPIARAHTIRVVAPAELPELFLDVAMAEQVFLNLLENALRFSPPGSEIRIEAAARNGAVEVRVVDHGRGVGSADRERIFDEFVRADGRAEAPGTGLGLAIVRSLVEVHGGQVWYEDTPGGGATFAVRFPTVEAETVR